MKAGIAIALLAAAAVRGQDTSRSVRDGVYAEPQTERGKPLYNQHCASCHGQAMTGGEMAPPLAGGEFLSNWNGLTAGDLFDRIRTSMPMNAPGKLSREVNADITAYILRFNGFPAGAAELDRRSEVLKQIRIEPAKPSPASAPPNSQPDPYRTVENWFKLPDGRTWGSMSAIYVTANGGFSIFAVLEST